jgi:pimeloyl-ACP methyl ester carboxylesterase
MERLTTPAGITVTYDKSGGGPPLVLVHGAFSDHRTNWELVKPILDERFTLYAIARRGRGGTDATAGHGLEDEVADVVAVIEAIAEPVFLLGHSHGAHGALAAAARVPERVRRLVIYEPAWPTFMSSLLLTRLEALAASGDWDLFAVRFFHDGLLVPIEELDALRGTDSWPPIVADAPASLHDIRGLVNCDFKPERFRSLAMPVLLQTGSESPGDLYVTNRLAAVLPDARIGVLPGQAHEGMTTAPEMYASAVTAFLLGVEEPLETASSAAAAGAGGSRR